MNKKDRVDNEILNLRNDIDNANTKIARLKLDLKMASILLTDIKDGKYRNINTMNDLIEKFLGKINE